MRRSRQRWDDVFSVLLRIECVGANWRHAQRSRPSWWALVDKASKKEEEKWQQTLL